MAKAGKKDTPAEPKAQAEPPALIADLAKLQEALRGVRFQPPDLLSRATFKVPFPDEPVGKPRKKAAPKSERAIDVLKGIEGFYQDGCWVPRSKVPDYALENKYNERCDELDISKNDRIKTTQLLIITGRKPPRKKG